MIDIRLENVHATVIKESMHVDPKDQLKLFTTPILHEYNRTSIFNIYLKQDMRGSVIDTKYRERGVSTSAVREIIYDVTVEDKRLIKFKTHNSYYLIIVHEE